MNDFVLQTKPWVESFPSSERLLLIWGEGQSFGWRRDKEINYPTWGGFFFLILQGKFFKNQISYTIEINFLFDNPILSVNIILISLLRDIVCFSDTRCVTNLI